MILELKVITSHNTSYVPNVRNGSTAAWASQSIPSPVRRAHPPSGPTSQPTLTLGLAVHAVGIPADVSYRLQSHGLTLARQPGLGIREERQMQGVSTWETFPHPLVMSGQKFNPFQRMQDEDHSKQPLLFRKKAQLTENVSCSALRPTG